MNARSLRRLGRPRGGVLLWALLPLVMGLGLTLWVAHEARQQQRKADQLRLDRHTQRVLKSLQSRLSSYEDLLRGAHAFLRQGPAPAAPVWRAYAQDLDFLHRHPGLKTLVYIECVPREGLSAFQARHSLQKLCVVKSLDPSDRALPGEGPDHFVITLAEPSETASKALGMDVGTSLHQRQAAERAARSGEPTLSGPLTFRLDGVPRTSLALFFPIYRSASLPATPEARRAQLKGWVSLGLYMDAFLDDIKQGSDDAVSANLFDLSEGQEIRLSPKVGPSFRELRATSQIHRLEVFGRTWGLASRPLPAFFEGAQRSRVTYILLVGLLASLSLGAVVWSLASTQERARRLAEHLTRGLREMLRRLDMLIESTPVGVVEWDGELRVRRWNPAAARIFGFGAEEVVEHSGEGIRVPGPGGKQALAALEEVLREGRSWSGPQEALRKDGQRIVCEWTNSPIYDAEGRVEGVLSLVMDMTERRRMEERAWLQQKVESLGVMAGGIAHDFNNLLWAISGNAELARDHLPAGNPAHENLARIETAAFRAADLARQMLAYSGRAPFLIQPVDLGEVLSEMAEMARAAMPRRVRIDFHVSSGVPGVRGDAGHIQQALSSLLTNAAEALGLGEGHVQVHVFPVRADGALLSRLVPGSALVEGPAACVEIQDDGPGIDPEMLGKVFDPFFTTKATGRGLGLSATLGIMRAHNGGITLESGLGQGTRIQLYFPATEEPLATPMAASQDCSRQAGGTVLVAEDEELLRDLTVEALEPAGFQVITAEDGQAALELFEARGAEISLVVLDLNMPRMGGLEAFRRIRSLDPTVKVIICSGYAEEEIGELVHELHPDGFLRKPYRIKELVRMVTELVS